MALFKSDPQKNLMRDIANATANRDRLRAKLGECEATIAEHRVQAQTAARDGLADSVLDLAEGLIRSSQDRAGTITAAIAEVELQLAGFEKTFAENADRAAREQAAASCEQLARRWTEFCAALVDAAAQLNDYGERVSAIIPDAHAAWSFSRTITDQIPPNAALIAQLLRQHGASVLAGHASAVLPQPAPAFVPPPVVPKPPVVTIFATQKLKWVDDAGKLHVAAKFTDVTLPLRCAERARELRACLELTDPVRQQYLRTVGGNIDPEGAVDLDAAPEPERSSGELHSAFEKPVVGEARILKIRA